MKLVCKTQPNLVTAHKIEDDGNFIFVICRRGMEEVLNKKLILGEKFFADVDVKFNSYLEKK